MKQNFFLFFLLVSSGLCAVDPTPPPKQMAPLPVQPNKSCGQLTQEEQLFSSKLSRIEDQNFFCQSMTAGQRSQVMAMTRPLSPDQAMQDYRKQMMQQNQATPPSGGVTPRSNKPSTGGSCPIN